MTERIASLGFDLAEAVKFLAERDEFLRPLIEQAPPFQLDVVRTNSPYEALVEAIAYQSISGKAAATIFGRITALARNGGVPTPEEMLKLRKPVTAEGRPLRRQDPRDEGPRA